MAVSILLLEDESATRDVLETALTDDGYDVVVCGSPVELMERTKQTPSSLALVDFWGRSQANLSEDERHELLQFTSAVPTILVTARQWAIKEAAEDLGVLSIVQKPFSLDE